MSLSNISDVNHSHTHQWTHWNFSGNKLFDHITRSKLRCIQIWSKHKSWINSHKFKSFFFWKFFKIVSCSLLCQCFGFFISCDFLVVDVCPIVNCKECLLFISGFVNGNDWTCSNNSLYLMFWSTFHNGQCSFNSWFDNQVFVFWTLQWKRRCSVDYILTSLNCIDNRTLFFQISLNKLQFIIELTKRLL